MLLFHISKVALVQIISLSFIYDINKIKYHYNCKKMYLSDFAKKSHKGVIEVSCGKSSY